MKYDYKKYPITTGVIGVCILVYIYTTIRYGVDMNANEGLETGGFNPILVVYFKALCNCVRSFDDSDNFVTMFTFFC